ncbi:YfkD family protein [Cytobacillus sp. Sa5YUA1]|uniref:YfkD family protein n=1 Tax=Cytobacillus stercorigallinarum TaxID=2762240 RepID=A0ABR8QSU2_9BACI|nr:YfkD famly protein [Cytobacillus stercorigallinarum]MBD7938558.1 YfkD family protein [Cytobacillus stercorigallinarum]
MKKWLYALVVMTIGVISFQSATSAEGKIETKEATIEIPSSVLNVEKDNTYPNPAQDLPTLQPSELTQELMETSRVKIDNPELIRMLNETTVNSTPFAIGYRAIVYLGQWPLNYQSQETSPNWEFQKINTNYFDNRGGDAVFQMNYVQEMQKIVKGGLTSKVPHSQDVKKMMLLKATEKSGLPLSFETIVGAGTKKDHKYHVAINRLGYLYAYAPAINEKGKVTYGEVYIMLKGNKKTLVVKNITSQGIGAWIPIQDHVSFGFIVSERPR